MPTVPTNHSDLSRLVNISVASDHLCEHFFEEMYAAFVSYVRCWKEDGTDMDDNMLIIVAIDIMLTRSPNLTKSPLWNLKEKEIYVIHRALLIACPSIIEFYKSDELNAICCVIQRVAQLVRDENLTGTHSTWQVCFELAFALTLKEASDCFSDVVPALQGVSDAFNVSSIDACLEKCKSVVAPGCDEMVLKWIEAMMFDWSSDEVQSIEYFEKDVEEWGALLSGSVEKLNDFQLMFFTCGIRSGLKKGVDALGSELFLLICRTMTNSPRLMKICFNASSVTSLLSTLVDKRQAFLAETTLEKQSEYHAIVSLRMLTLLFTGNTGDDVWKLAHALSEVLTVTDSLAHSFCKDWMRHTMWTEHGTLIQDTDPRSPSMKWCVLFLKITQMLSYGATFDDEFVKTQRPIDDFALAIMYNVWKHLSRDTSSRVLYMFVYDAIEYVCEVLDLGSDKPMINRVGLRLKSVDLRCFGSVLLRPLKYCALETAYKRRFSPTSMEEFEEFTRTEGDNLVTKVQLEREQEADRLDRKRNSKKEKKKRREEMLKQRSATAEALRREKEVMSARARIEANVEEADRAVLSSISVARKMLSEGASPKDAEKRVRESMRRHHTHCSSNALKERDLFLTEIGAVAPKKTVCSEQRENGKAPAGETPVEDHEAPVEDHKAPVEHRISAGTTILGGDQPSEDFREHDHGTHTGTIQQMIECPISLATMQDPVIAADGHTYERKFITEWLELGKTSPLTGAPLAHSNLVPNHTLRLIIEMLDEEE